MEKIKLLLYCTKSKPTLYNVLGKFITTKYMRKDFMQDGITHPELNGKIVAECDFEVEEISKVKDIYDDTYFYDTPTLYYDELLKKSCLNNNQLEDYLEFKGYAIHIKNLHIFDKPKELNECWANTNAWIFSNEKLYVAPQNMRYCGDWNLKKAILISIRPEYLVRILNKEKTIEVRKKVLKEMIK